VTAMPSSILKKLFLSVLLIIFLLVVGCDITNSVTPSGTYTATVLGIEQTFTFKGDTITRYDPLGGKAIFKYYFTDKELVQINPLNPNAGYEYQPPPSIKVPADKAKTIWMQNISSGEWHPAKFKYIPEQEMIVLWDISYFKE